MICFHTHLWRTLLSLPICRHWMISLICLQRFRVCIYQVTTAPNNDAKSRTQLLSNVRVIMILYTLDNVIK